jgi:hypothetical protein
VAGMPPTASRAPGPPPVSGSGRAGDGEHPATAPADRVAATSEKPTVAACHAMGAASTLPNSQSRRPMLDDRPQAPVSTAPLERFRPGDPAPWFHAATAANPRYAFDSVAGRYVLLAFLGSAAAHPPSAAAWEALRAARAAGLLDDERASAFAVSADPADAAPGADGGAPRLRDEYPGLRVFRDHGLDLSRSTGGRGGARRRGRPAPGLRPLRPAARPHAAGGRVRPDRADRRPPRGARSCRRRACTRAWRCRRPCWCCRACWSPSSAAT